MSSVNSRSSEQQFVSLVKHCDVPGVRALLQSMSSDKARSRLYQATCEGFEGVFEPYLSWVG